MSEEETEEGRKAIKKREITIDLVGIFVSILIPMVMFAPLIAAIFGFRMPFLFGWGWAALLFAIMCVWGALVLRNDYYFVVSLMIIALVSMLSLFVVKICISA